MSRFARSSRRSDQWASTHERARARAAERMSGDLEPTEAAWLDAHVADCPACASIAAAYEVDRLALRVLNDLPAQPPRDLWARTAAAIERESAMRHRSDGGTRRGRARLPLGALSGIAVIAVVVGVSTLSQTMTSTPKPGPDQEPSQRSTTGGDNGSELAGAGATPFAVGAGEVEYILRESNGLLAVNRLPIDEVCPGEDTAGCPALRDTSAQSLAMAESPRTIIGSPTDRNAIVVAKDTGNGDQIFVVALPAVAATAPPSSVATQPPAATLNPVAGTRPPTTSADPGASASTDTGSPTVSPSEAVPSSPSDTPEPSASLDIDTAASPSVAPTVQATPTLSPEPSVAVSLAIASDIEVVGESAAFSADGAWFAFTARPADRSTGPDVYVWRVGETTAFNLTEDGTTIFASWVGGQVAASRPEASTDGATPSPVSPLSVLIDPTTGIETPAGGLWLPAVDPTRQRAIAWNGSIERAADGTTWTPEDGQLELRAWSAETGGQTSGGPAADDERIVTDELGQFDIRWDETGEWVAVWIADPNDPDIGRLSLYRVDLDTGRLERSDDAPDGVAALPGFSIARGRLAWASPPGQEGEGSRIQIVAWSGEGVGSVESAPGEDLIIIR